MDFLPVSRRLLLKQLFCWKLTRVVLWRWENGGENLKIFMNGASIKKKTSRFFIGGAIADSVGDLLVS